MLYCRNRNGKLYSRHEVETAYEITTGRKYNYTEDGLFLKWLNHYLGNAIIDVVREEDIDYVTA